MLNYSSTILFNNMFRLENPMNKSLLLITLLSASLSSYADDGWKAFFEEVQLDKVSPINQTLKLPLTDLNGNALSENTIASGIIYSLLSNSQYPYNSSKQEKNVFFKGITAKYVPAEHTILVNYRNEKDYTSSMIIINGSGDVTYNVKDTIFKVGLTLTPVANQLAVAESLPNAYTIRRSSIYNWGTQDPLDSPAKLYVDLSNSLNPASIVIPQQYILSGESDNKYSPDSIYGNFDRLMTKYDWKTNPTCTPLDMIQKAIDNQATINSMSYAMCGSQYKPTVQENAQEEYSSNPLVAKMMAIAKAKGQVGAQQSEKIADAPTPEQYAAKLGITPKQMETTYTYKYGDLSIPVAISIFPYHNQSKVSYKAIIPYTIKGDGATSLSKEQINQIKQAIEKVINS